MYEQPPEEDVMPKPDPLKPDAALLVKLGSFLVHTEEFFGDDSHPYDRAVLESILADPGLQAWIQAMTELALLPVKRSA